MILGFKGQFVPFVLDGTKTHTIRAGQRWTDGMRADLFTGPYKPGRRRLPFRAPVVGVERIEIFFSEKYRYYDNAGVLISAILIGGCELSADEMNAFAFRDGFRSGKFRANADFAHLREMSAYWRRTDTEPFVGQIIHWDFEQRYIPCGDCGRSHPRGPCNAMVRSDWRLPRPGEMERVLCAR